MINDGSYGVDLEMIVNLVGMTEDRLTSNLLNVHRINMNKIFSYIDAINYGKMAVFFTKPDLNIFVDKNFSINPSIKANCPDLAAKINANPIIAAQLQSSLSPEGAVGGLGFINILGSRCNSIDVPELNLSLKQAPENSKGQSMKYGGDFFESLSGDSFNITFLDDRYANVKTLIEIWLEYIEGVNNGTIDPKKVYIGENRIDYAISIYIFALDEMSNIINSVSLVGVFPTSSNMQLAQYSPLALDAEKFLGPFNYSFHFTYMTKPNSNRVYEAFNYVSGWKEKSKNFNDGAESVEYMYTNMNGYWIHNGHIHLNAFLPHNQYPYSFDLYNFWAEIAGITYRASSGGVIQYQLLYATKNFKNKRGLQFHEFYKNPVSRIRQKPKKEPYMGSWLEDDDWTWEWNGTTYVRSSTRNQDPYGNPYITPPNGTPHLRKDKITNSPIGGTGHYGFDPLDYGNVKFEEHLILDSNNPKLTNLNRFNASYQYQTESLWDNHGFNGWGKWDWRSGSRYGNTKAGGGQSNAQYALNLISNLQKIF